SKLHKHGEKVTGAGGIFTDGALTRFTDMQTLLEEAKTNPDAGDLAVRSPGGARIMLNEFENRKSNWRRRQEFSIEPNDQDKPAFDALLKKHSQDVMIGPGDLALWANDGRIFHQALLVDHKYHRGPVRGIISTALDPM